MQWYCIMVCKLVFFFFFFEEFIESVNCSYFVPLKLHNMIDMNIAILNS